MASLFAVYRHGSRARVRPSLLRFPYPLSPRYYFLLLISPVADIHSFPNICGEAREDVILCVPDAFLSLFLFKVSFPPIEESWGQLLRIFKPSSTSTHVNTQKMLCLEY